MDPHHRHHHHHEPPPPPVVHHHHEPPKPAVVVHHVHHESPSTPKPTYKVFCRAEPNHVLSVRDGKVILARANPSDPHQVCSPRKLWCQDSVDNELQGDYGFLLTTICSWIFSTGTRKRSSAPKLRMKKGYLALFSWIKLQDKLSSTLLVPLTRYSTKF